MLFARVHISMYSAASLQLSQRCCMRVHFECAVGIFPLALNCWWVGGGGELCSSSKLRTDRCSVLSAVYSWHPGSMGHFNTSTLYPHGTADGAVELSLTFNKSLSASFLSQSLWAKMLLVSFLLYCIFDFDFSKTHRVWKERHNWY